MADRAEQVQSVYGSNAIDIEGHRQTNNYRRDNQKTNIQTERRTNKEKVCNIAQKQLQLDMDMYIYEYV